MGFATGLRCVRCGRRYPLGHYDRDCPACRPEAPSGLAVEYDAAMLAPRAPVASGADSAPIGAASRRVRRR